MISIRQQLTCDNSKGFSYVVLIVGDRCFARISWILCQDSPLERNQRYQTNSTNLVAFLRLQFDLSFLFFNTTHHKFEYNKSIFLKRYPCTLATAEGIDTDVCWFQVRFVDTAAVPSHALNSAADSPILGVCFVRLQNIFHLGVCD